MRFDVDMASDQAELFLDVRSFIMECIEKNSLSMIERYTDNITSYYCDEYEGGFCYIKTKEDYVHIGWFQGVHLKDTDALLFGNGKTVKGQKVTVLDKTQESAIESFIGQTLILSIERSERKQLKKAIRNK